MTRSGSGNRAMTQKLDRPRRVVEYLSLALVLEHGPMDFDQLETFLEVARHPNFSRDAGKRFRTQPAISSQIRSLEDEVGAKLFDRSGGKGSLTASGKVFQKFCEDTIATRRALLTAVLATETVARGELSGIANAGT